MRPRDLTGQVFTRLTVEGTPVVGVSRVRCTCGTVKLVRSSHLTSGATKSCGCLAQESRLARSTKHGHARSASRTPEFDAWKNMKGRCYNTGRVDYWRYGGRGITVCERWRHDYLAFFADMGRRPSPTHSLDRIDNNGSYEPSNCRWATKKEQSENRRSIIKVKMDDGSTVTLTEACARLGLEYTKIRQRVRRYGWSLEDAFTTPGIRRRKAA